MDGGATLGEFLRSRRAGVRPEDAGLTSYGVRRVPGLRREELAQLAGVSPTYYTRLEQGHSTGASAAVLDALARALALTADERAHLFDLAQVVPCRSGTAATRCAPVAPGTRQLVDAVGVPAALVGPCTEVVAWNALGHRLLAPHLDPAAPHRDDDRPNLTRLLFLDPRTRELYPRRDLETARAVGSLHLVAGGRPDDRGLAELVGQLSVKSPEFAALWSRHPVAACVSGTKEFHHPDAGDLTLSFEALLLPDASGRRLFLYTAAPGTADQAALSLLARRPEPAAPAEPRAVRG